MPASNLETDESEAVDTGLELYLVRLELESELARLLRQEGL